MVDHMDTAAAWTLVADAWDESVDYVDEHSAAATAELVQRVAICPGDRVLELAAGPGSLAATWARLVGPAGAVVVSDLAPGMVGVAARRNASLGNVEIALLDASAIDRADGSFDVVVCRMGLMFTPEPATALAEMHRVLAPEGRLGALTWGGIEHNPWMTCVGMAAMANGVVAGGPPVGPGGVFSLGDPGHVTALAEGAGFSGVAVEEIAVTFRSSDVRTHVERVGALAGPLGVALRGAPPDQREAVLRTAAELAAPHLTDDGLVMPGRALLLSGRR